MAIAELVAPRTFSVRDYQAPPPGPGEVQVRVSSVGICGSDLHNFSEGGVGGSIAVYPQVLGHEPSGTITAVGAGVTGWAPGDRAALEPPLYCYHCEFCMTGRHNLCHTVKFLSNPDAPGYFRDHVNLPLTNVLPIPDNISLDEATLFEPIGIILHSFRFGDPKLGETAAVFGAGAIGLCTIAGLKIAGASRIFCIEPLAHRRSLALALGADVVLDPNDCDPVHEVLHSTNQRGVDLVFDCAGKADTHNQCFYMGAPAARIVLTALPASDRLSIDFNHFRRREQFLFPVRRSNHKSDLALRLLKERPQAFSPMITHRLPLENVQRAFELFESYSDGVGKILLKP